MKTYRPLPFTLFLIWSALRLGLAPAHAQGTAFTYQGSLVDGPNPASGSYDLQFGLWSAASGPVQVGGTLTRPATPVSNGLFTVTLDFGNQFPGADRWLEIGVRTNGGGAFSTLSPRQPLTPVPYAVTAANVAAGAGLAGTYSNAVTLNNAANSFSGNGAGLTALNANNLSSGTVPSAALGNAWKTTGNSGTTPGPHFIGTTDTQPLEFKVNGVRALRLEPGTFGGGAPNMIGGSPRNFVAAGVQGATIGGGGATNYSGSPYTNSVSADFGTIGGGLRNRIQANAASTTIGGGVGNTIQTNASDSTIGGGAGNTIQVSAYSSTIGGGTQNTIQTNAGYSTIGGGYLNRIQTNAFYATIGGGNENTIQLFAAFATIGGGDRNEIEPDADRSTIGGGIVNTIQIGAAASAIGGGYVNTIQTNATRSTIGGGGGNTIQRDSAESAIGGGDRNTIQTNAYRSTIGGGSANTIQANAMQSTIGGGEQNTIQGNASASTIGGGYGNTIQTYADHSTIGGGWANAIQIDAYWSTISGGYVNTIQSNANHSAIGGGGNNTIETNAIESTIGGGSGNTIQANLFGSVIGGGYNNRASASLATVPGGSRNAAGQLSFAAGNRAKATHTGSFVWADSTEADFSTTGQDQFLIRATGGVGIGKTNPATALDVNGSVTTRGFNIVAVTTNAPTASSTLTAASGYVVLSPATAVTLNATTAIGAGTTPGQMLILRGNSNTFTVTINDNAGTALGANRVLGLNDILSLIWTGSAWAEISYANN